MKVRKAIIPAAGFGTRFLPATKAQPKEMLPIVDKPTIQYIVEEAVESGIEDILIVTGRGKRSIEDHFDYSIELEGFLKSKGDISKLNIVKQISELVDIHYIRQKKISGLGHAILCARKFIGDEPFAVLLADDIVKSAIPCTRQLIDIYEETNSTVVGVKKVSYEELFKYGVVSIANCEGPYFRINGLVEKPAPGQAPSNLAVMGRYIISPKIFELLEKVKPSVGGEIQLTDALRMLCQEENIYAYEFQGKRYDAGDKMGYLTATIEFALDRPELKLSLSHYILSLAKMLGNNPSKLMFQGLDMPTNPIDSPKDDVSVKTDISAIKFN